MPAVKDNIITTKVDSELKIAFMAIAESKDRPASQILRELIRVYVESNEIPNKLTHETMQKSLRGEDVYYADNASDLFRQLDI